MIPTHYMAECTVRMWILKSKPPHPLGIFSLLLPSCVNLHCLTSLILHLHGGGGGYTRTYLIIMWNLRDTAYGELTQGGTGHMLKTYSLLGLLYWLELVPTSSNLGYTQTHLHSKANILNSGEQQCTSNTENVSFFEIAQFWQVILLFL